MEVLHGKLIRTQLGVRHSIPLDLCLIEVNMLPLRDLIVGCRRAFMDKALAQQMDGSPLSQAVAIAGKVRCVQLQSFHSDATYSQTDLQERRVSHVAGHTRYATNCLQCVQKSSCEGLFPNMYPFVDCHCPQTDLG